MPASRSCAGALKMLTQTLRGLERDGLVRRTVYPEVPVRVEYALTEAGRTLREPLRALEEWSIAHLGDVSASQEAYDCADRPPADSANRGK
jgi:DNA-binding HxlR family transcriptional regulator